MGTLNLLSELTSEQPKKAEIEGVPTVGVKLHPPRKVALVLKPETKNLTILLI